MSPSTVLVIERDDDTDEEAIRLRPRSPHTPKHHKLPIARSRSDTFNLPHLGRTATSATIQPSSPRTTRSPILVRRTKSLADYKLPSFLIIDCDDPAESKELSTQRPKTTHEFAKHEENNFNLSRSMSDTDLVSSSYAGKEVNALLPYIAKKSPIIIRKSTPDSLHAHRVNCKSRSTPHLPTIMTNDELVSGATDSFPRQRKKRPEMSVLVQMKRPTARGRRRRRNTRPGYRSARANRNDIIGDRANRNKIIDDRANCDEMDEESTAAPVSKRQTCASLFAVAITLCLTAIGLWITQSLTAIIGGDECRCPPMPTCAL
uniref:Uncharacterized protein n=1 Tax=Melicertus latisulcatus pemonivirus TaxID=2984278 RepID=A0A9C7CDC9_9VIRU|nr:MAG: hypothetical protein [Melicertus latisulcatus pemonivirus]